MASLVLWPPKLPDYRRDKRPTAGRTGVCVCAQNHWCKLTHPAWAQMATSPSSHGTVEELSPRESWSSTLPPKPTTPSLPVVYNALHSPSIFLDLWLIVCHFHVFFLHFSFSEIWHLECCSSLQLFWGFFGLTSSVCTAAILAIISGG